MRAPRAKDSVLEGQMCKEKGWRKKWTAWRFVLCGSTRSLRYYARERSRLLYTAGALRGTIKMDGASVESADDPGRHGLLITTRSGKRHPLRCASARDKARWSRALTAVASGTALDARAFCASFF